MMTLRATAESSTTKTTDAFVFGGLHKYRNLSLRDLLVRPEWKLLINRRSGRSEQPGLPQRFGVTDKQVSGWMQGIVKAPDQASRVA